MNRSTRFPWLLLFPLCLPAWAQTPSQWKAHDMARPRPGTVEPPAALTTPPPPDAVVLFGGSDLSRWQSADEGPAPWAVRDGYFEIVPGSGSILTREGFGDVQLHVEWMVPEFVEGEGQNRGNSGIYFMGRYEVQVLDSHANDTYPDGQAASIYGQRPPLVNASRPTGQWQSYDIVFRRPRFDHAGVVVEPARLTVLHNGVLVQDCVRLVGPTMWLQPLPYRDHPDRLPLLLQDHDSPVRFRNVWLRELREFEDPGPPAGRYPAGVRLPAPRLERYPGRYQFDTGDVVTLSLEGGVLRAHFFGPMSLELVPLSEREFELRRTAARFTFELDPGGRPVGVTFQIGGDSRQGRRLP